MPRAKPVNTDNDRHRSKYELNPRRICWTTINRREFVLYTDDNQAQPDLEEVWLQFSSMTKRFCLTAMTSDELAVLKELFLAAIETAEPIVAELDRRALDDYAKGIDVHVRLYRPPAQLFRHGNPNLLGSPGVEREQQRDTPSVPRGSPGLP